MIKLIIHFSDVHIRCFARQEEYAEQLTKFIDKCKEISKPYKKEEVRVVCSGDLVHQKNQTSPELFVFASTFIRQLEEIAQVIIISGNHDLLVNNTSRKDTMTALFETANFQNSVFVDGYLGFDSGTLIDDNVTWALYSIYADYRKPDIAQARQENPTNTVIGLYHGTIIGATLNNGTVMQDGTDGETFNGCDIVMAGDIHKRQELKRGNVPIVYPGSLIQQTFGETVTQHGFCVWNLEEKTHHFIDLETEYGLYDFQISGVDDMDENKETLLNY